MQFGNARFTTIPLKPLSDQNVEDIVFFLGLKVSKSHLYRETTIEITKFYIDTKNLNFQKMHLRFWIYPIIFNFA